MTTTFHIPTLRTERLTLRAPKMSDLEAYIAFRASDRSRHVGGPFPAETAMPALGALAGHWVLRGFGRWIVADRQSDAALGIVGPYYPQEWPEPEIAWTLFGDAEGRGIAFEAATAALDFAYGTLNWTRAISCVAPDNERSLALALRLGAKREDAFVHPVYGTLDIYRHAGPDDLKTTTETADV